MEKHWKEIEVDGLPKTEGMYEVKAILAEGIRDGIKTTRCFVAEDYFIPGVGWFNTGPYHFWRNIPQDTPA